ncbi:CLUMA_CG015050, isoform A [Clunio marinus]|uniref:Apolipoprotein D n=1 Tax=Clunio marinus TaxID=568069 RepID=A0A1J1IPN9_9DIPT|nr:CLUMA_CG015050, isoform A [Clunio marinus]
MKGHLLIVICAIFTGIEVNSQVPGFGRCPRTSAVQNFDVNAYLGRWFEIESYFQTFAIGGTCVEANYGLNPNGTVSVLNKMTRLGREESILGYAVLASPGEGKLIVNFPQSPPTDTPNYIILSTDYVNYAVVHSCTQISRFTYVQIAWILARNRQIGAIQRFQARRVLENNGVSTRWLRETDQSNCG